MAAAAFILRDHELPQPFRVVSRRVRQSEVHFQHHPLLEHAGAMVFVAIAVGGLPAVGFERLLRPLELSGRRQKIDVAAGAQRGIGVARAGEARPLERREADLFLLEKGFDVLQREALR